MTDRQHFRDQMTLFPSPNEPTARDRRALAIDDRRRAEAEARAAAVVEPMAADWHFMAQRSGVIGFAHRISSRSKQGGALTLCGLAGRPIDGTGIATMIRCPLCDSEAGTLHSAE